MKKAIKKAQPEITVVAMTPTTNESNDRLTISEALELLGTHISKRKKRVHTFMGGSFALMGCDVDLTDIKKALKETDDICLAGPNMAAMGHGVAFWNKHETWEFISTDKEKLMAIHKERNIKYPKY